MGKKRAYSAKPSITSGDRSRASLPGLALLLGIGAGGGPWGPQATGLMPAALGQMPQKPPGQIPCQQLTSLPVGNQSRLCTKDSRSASDTYSATHLISPEVQIANRISDSGEPCETSVSTGCLSMALASFLIRSIVSE